MAPDEESFRIIIVLAHAAGLARHPVRLWEKFRACMVRVHCSLWQALKAFTGLLIFNPGGWLFSKTSGYQRGELPTGNNDVSQKMTKSLLGGSRRREHVFGARYTENFSLSDARSIGDYYYGLFRAFDDWEVCSRFEVGRLREKRRLFYFTHECAGAHWFWEPGINPACKNWLDSRSRIG